MNVVERGSKPLVLIVEDDPWIRELAGELLEDEGFAIATAADGHAGLAMAETLHPAVVLLDLGLPRMSGGEFLAHLRENASLCETPVIVVSGQSGALSADVSAQANQVLRKPFDLNALLEGLRKAAAIPQHT